VDGSDYNWIKLAGNDTFPGCKGYCPSPADSAPLLAANPSVFTNYVLQTANPNTIIAATVNVSSVHDNTLTVAVRASGIGVESLQSEVQSIVASFFCVPARRVAVVATPQGSQNFTVTVTVLASPPTTSAAFHVGPAFFAVAALFTNLLWWI